MERSVIYLFLSGFLFVISIFNGIAFFIFENDYDRTRFVELIIGTVVTLLYSLAYYISARVKENKKESGGKNKRRAPSRQP